MLVSQHIPIIGCVLFVQIVHQETGPESRGRSQSAGSDRGRLQEAGARKVSVMCPQPFRLAVSGSMWTCRLTDPLSTSLVFFSSVSQKHPSPSSSSYLQFSCSPETPNLWRAGPCSSPKGRRGVLNPKCVCPCMLLSVHWVSYSRSIPYACYRPSRYVSDAVTGVIIVSILFFFPSQKPSLSWWFNPQGQRNHTLPLYSIMSSSICWMVCKGMLDKTGEKRLTWVDYLFCVIVLCRDLHV